MLVEYISQIVEVDLKCQVHFILHIKDQNRRDCYLVTGSLKNIC